MVKRRVNVPRRTNEHICKYVAEYLKMKKTDFAVLITGAWGTGKSTFVRQDLIPNLFKEENKRRGCWYISLNGITTQKEINALLFQQAHSVLGSKYARLAGRIVGGLLQTGLHVDLKCGSEIQAVGNTKQSVENCVGADINLVEAFGSLFSVAKGKPPKIIIFDDLERVRMPMKEILGVIGGIVEEGTKVLVVANEDEVVQKNEYLTAKEKVIGRTFRFRQDLYSLYGVLVGDGVYPHAETVLREAKAKIVKTLLRESDDTAINYRAVKHAFRDFDYLRTKGYPNDIKENESFWDDFVWRFIIFSYEYHLGNLSDDFSVHMMLLEDGGKKQSKKLLIGYHFEIGTDDPRDVSLVSSQMFNALVTGKSFREEDLFTDIKLCRYFVGVKQPDWVRLWYWFVLDDDEAKAIISKTIDGVSALQYKVPGEVVQIFNCLISLGSEGVASCGSINVETFHEYVDTISAKALWDLRLGEDAVPDDDQWKGLRFWGYDASPERVNEMCRYIKTKVEQHKKDSETARRLSIVNSMATRPLEFVDFVNQYPVGFTEEYSIFSGINPKEFFNAFISLSNENRRKVALVIGSKRRGVSEINHLDGDFYKSVKVLADEYLEKYKGEELPSIANVRFLRDEFSKMN